MKKSILIPLIAVLVVVGYFYYSNQINVRLIVPSADYKKAEYIISGQKTKLGDGVFTYFGNEVKTDLNKDGRMDTAFLITQKKSDGALWYFLVGALNTADGYVGTQGVLIGDRISPQSTNMNTQAGKEDQIVVNYAVGSNPSVGKSLWLKYDAKDKSFGEVVQNFEGETR